MKDYVSWYPYGNGKTSENSDAEKESTTLLDEEHPMGARIILKNTGESWAVACAVYGSMSHTALANSELEGREKYAAMKSEIEGFLEYLYSDAVEDDKAFEILGDWVSEFTRKH